MARRFAALALILCAGIAQAQVEYEDAGSFEVTQTGRIDGNYQRAEVLMPAPLDGPMQTVSDLVVEPPGVDLLVDEGKEVCLARMNIQEPGTSATLTIRYNIKCHPPRYDMQRWAPGASRNTTGIQTCTASTRRLSAKSRRTTRAFRSSGPGSSSSTPTRLHAHGRSSTSSCSPAATCATVH